MIRCFAMACILASLSPLSHGAAPTTAPTTRPIRIGALADLRDDEFWQRERPVLQKTGGGRVENDPGHMESLCLTSRSRTAYVFVFDTPENATAGMEDRCRRVASVIERGKPTEQHPGPWWYCNSSCALLTIQYGRVLVEITSPKHHFDPAEEKGCWAFAAKVNAAIGGESATRPASGPAGE